MIDTAAGLLNPVRVSALDILKALAARAGGIALRRAGWRGDYRSIFR